MKISNYKGILSLFIIIYFFKLKLFKTSHVKFVRLPIKSLTKSLTCILYAIISQNSFSKYLIFNNLTFFYSILKKSETLWL